MFEEDDKQSLIMAPVLSILQEADIVQKIKKLGDHRLLGADFIKISSNKYGESHYDFSNPKVVINFIKTYSKLEKILNELEKTKPQIAREAAMLITKQLTAFCQYYDSSSEGYHSHLNTNLHNPFSTVDYSTITSSLGQPNQLLETLETELTTLLRPVIEINATAKVALVTGCLLVGIAVSVTLSIFVTEALSMFIPGLQSAVESMSLSVMDIGLGNHTPLLSIPNAMSVGVGGILGAGSGFFAIHKIQQSRFSPFHQCMKATHALQKKLECVNR